MGPNDYELPDDLEIKVEVDDWSPDDIAAVFPESVNYDVDVEVDYDGGS